MKRSGKALSLFLTLALALTPALGGTARADGAGKAIRLGADGPVGISLGMNAVANGDTVWFGAKDSSPIAWRVLSAAGDNTLPVSGSSDVLAIRKYLLNDRTYFKEVGSSNAWAGSDAQTWCTNYYNNWPAGAEKDAIKATSVTETNDKETGGAPYFYQGGYYTNYYGPASLTNEHFFFLSAQEADTYFANDDDRKAKDAESSGTASWWWLRSPIAGNDYDAGDVDGGGLVIYCRVSDLDGARPAFNFNLNSVLFSSAAAGGKSTSAAGALDAPAANTTNEWKLTLLDTDETTGQHKNFAVTETTAAAVAGGTVTLTYSGAATGTNEYVSALLCDSTGATVLRYGSSAALTSANGTVSFTVPSDLALGSYKLKVFNEQRNDDYMSDYAGNPVTVALTVKQTIAPAVTLAGWTYGEVAKTPAVTGNTGSGAVTYAYKAKNAEDTAYVADVPVNAGEYTVRATVAETANYFGGTATADFTIAAKSLAGATVSVENQTYTGSALTPTVTVKDGGKTLTEGTDYTVNYENNTNVGSATVIVAGKGNYTDSKTAQFTINAKPITGAAVSVENQTYTVSALTPAVTVTDSGKTLTEGTDYTVAYKNNTNVGSATVTVTGKGNYTGTKTAQFTITLMPSLANGMVTAPQGARLILATYSGGRMTGMRSVTISADCADADAATLLGVTLPASGYKLMLVDGSTYAPLCAAWEE